MKLEVQLSICAVHFVGIVTTLRRLYPPATEVPEAIRAVVARIEPSVDPRRSRPPR